MLPNSLLLDVVSFLCSEALAAIHLSSRDLNRFIFTRLNELPKQRLAVYVTNSVPSLKCKFEVGRRSLALETERLSDVADSILIRVLYFAYGLKFTDELLQFLDDFKRQFSTAKCMFYALPSTVSACRSLFSSILRCKAMHFHVEEDREHALWPSFTLPCIQACEKLIVSGPLAVDFVMQSRAIEWLKGDGTKVLRWDLAEVPPELRYLGASKFGDFVDGLKKDFNAATEATEYEVIIVGLRSPHLGFLETNGTTKERLNSSVLHTFTDSAFQIKREPSSFEVSVLRL